MQFGKAVVKYRIPILILTALLMVPFRSCQASGCSPCSFPFFSLSLDLIS